MPCTARMRRKRRRMRSPGSSARRSSVRGDMTTPAAKARINLLGLDRPGLRALLQQAGEKPFRADQLMQWIYQRGVTDFEAMTNLAKPLRRWLQENAEVRLPELVAEQTSQDGTRKWVLR